MEARTYSVREASPTDKSDDGLARGLPGKISTAATQTVAKGGPLVELAASIAISVNTVARQQQGIKHLYKQINGIKKRGTQASSIGTMSGGGMMVTVCTYYEAVCCTAPQRMNACYFNPRKMTDQKEWD